MRILGIWEKYDAPYVIATLVSNQFKIEHEVKFLIDTGASKTIVSDKDAALMRVDYRKLDKTEATLGIGGLVDTYLLPEVKLFFKSEEGIHEEYLSEIFVIRHRIRNPRIAERVKYIPSLLGRDFLNRYTLYLDKRKNQVLITD